MRECQIHPLEAARASVRCTARGVEVPQTVEPGCNAPAEPPSGLRSAERQASVRRYSKAGTPTADLNLK